MWTDDPVVLTRRELGMPARDGIVRQRKLTRIATDERRRIRQFESPAFVRTL
jgi:hypothetical protein